MATNWPEADASWDDLGANGANLRVSEFLSFHVLRLGGITKASIAREYLEPAGLTVPEWRILATVANFTPVPFSDITAMTAMDKGQVSRTLRSAQAKGYITTELVPIDRKTADGSGSASSSSISRVVVSLTPEGSAMYQKVMPQAQAYQASLIAQMTPEERTVVLRVLQRLYRHMAVGAKRA